MRGQIGPHLAGSEEATIAVEADEPVKVIVSYGQTGDFGHSVFEIYVPRTIHLFTLPDLELSGDYFCQVTLLDAGGMWMNSTEVGYFRTVEYPADFLTFQSVARAAERDRSLARDIPRSPHQAGFLFYAPTVNSRAGSKMDITNG